jgi:SAM-dependent methyltransferase
MTMEVLLNEAQIDVARQELDKRGLSTLDTPWRSLARRVGLTSGVKIGDRVKSWDLLQSINFIERHLAKSDAVLDIGCYASEILISLHRAGFTDLTGLDLNPKVSEMPHSDSIRFKTGNFMNAPFADASFRAITSISVIEHGFNGPALLHEMSRLLQSGGYFIASFDYWHNKIDTANVKFFGMDWKIFSQEEIENIVRDAANYNLYPVGELQLIGKDQVIHCGGKDYTFGWLVLQKR